jgi:hypothetical protein
VRSILESLRKASVEVALPSWFRQPGFIGYSLRYLPGNPSRTPDMEITIPNGLGYNKPSAIWLYRKNRHLVAIQHPPLLASHPTNFRITPQETSCLPCERGGAMVWLKRGAHPFLIYRRENRSEEENRVRCWPRFNGVIERHS